MPGFYSAGDRIQGFTTARQRLKLVSIHTESLLVFKFEFFKQIHLHVPSPFFPVVQTVLTCPSFKSSFLIPTPGPPLGLPSESFAMNRVMIVSAMKPHLAKLFTKRGYMDGAPHVLKTCLSRVISQHLHSVQTEHC